MKSKIWGLGLSRTGTTTLSTVLNQLGYRHIHYPSYDEMFALSNDGCSDIPVIPIYKELDQKFPNSKFVYTIRDRTEWLEKMGPYLERKRNWNQGAKQVNLRVEVYKNAFFDYNTYSKAYDDHDKDVKEYFKNRPKDLLILDIIGGDKPQKLYDFLGVDKKAPDEFPVVNKLKK
jgi:hypothetical protein